MLDNLTTLREASPDINELYYGNSQGLYYRTPEGWDVWLGESGAMREKACSRVRGGSGHRALGRATESDRRAPQRPQGHVVVSDPHNCAADSFRQVTGEMSW